MMIVIDRPPESLLHQKTLSPFSINNNHQPTTMLQADSQTQCHRHPHLPVTGFCASCLRERLTGLEEEEETTTTTHTSTTTRNFIKSIFSRHTTDPNPSLLPSSSSLFPGLRRCQSFSVAGRVAITSPFLPHRRSCDVVRPRNTLSSLFHLHNDQPGGLHHVNHTPKSDDLPPHVAPLHQHQHQHQRHGNDNDNDEVFQDVVIEEDDQNDKTVPVVIEDKVIGGLQKEKENVMTIGGEEREKKEPAKATKQPKDLKEIAGSFWTAASLFSKKLQKWRRKQKMKRQQQPREGIILDEMRGVQEEEEKKKNGFHYASSDVFGGRRRSCDIDTRFCLDGGRTSLDESRVSWDEARASWDGYLTGGGRTIFSTRLPQLTVEEDTIDKVPRSDGLIPVEEDMDRFLPGGTAQTRDYYYLDPSQRRRRSIDRSMNVDETKVVSVAATDAAEVSIGNGGGSVGIPKLNRDSNSFRRRDSTDSVDDVVQNKSRKWSKAWNIWGFINRKTSSIPRTAGVGNAMKGTTPLELRRRYRDIDSENRRVCRSHSGRWSSSSRYSTIDNCGANSCGGGYGSARKSSLEVNGHAMKKREEFVTCGRRRYLAAAAASASSPGRNSNNRRHGGGAGNDNHHRYKNNNTDSFARSMMQFY